MIERFRRWLRLWLFPEVFQLEHDLELLKNQHKALRTKVYQFRGKH